MIGKLLLIDLGLINTRLRDSKNDIDDSLNTKFTKGKESSIFYNNRESRTRRVEEIFLNGTRTTKIVCWKRKYVKNLFKASENTSEEIQKINESLRKLRKRAETTINYKHLPYDQRKNTYLPTLETSRFTQNKNVIRFVKSIIKHTTDTNLNTDILENIIKKRTDKQTYKNLEIQVLIHIDHTTEDIVKFFIGNYCCPGMLEEDLIEYHQKTGTTKFCFKNDDHRNLNMAKLLDIIQLIELHLIGLNSIIMSKELYEEYISSSDLIFQDKSFTSSYINKITTSESNDPA